MLGKFNYLNIFQNKNISYNQIQYINEKIKINICFEKINF